MATLLAGVVGGLSLLGATEASAALALHTAYWSPFQCSVETYGGDTVTAKAPNMTSVTGGLENVHWSPDLYRYGSGGWYLYDGSKPWAISAATGTGVSVSAVAGTAWQIPGTGGWSTPITGMSWQNLPAGSYRVKDYYYWDKDGSSTSAWPSYSGGSYYCYFSR